MSEFESLLLNDMSAAAWDKDMGIVDDTDEDTLQFFHSHMHIFDYDKHTYDFRLEVLTMAAYF